MKKLLQNFKLLSILFVLLGLFTSGKMLAQTNYYYNGSGNINAVASWGTNTNGTGTAPTNFTTANRIFNIRNSATPTLNGTWTVSGTGSKIIVGDGTNACNFTVGSNFVLTATVDVSAAATITLSTTGSITNINFGTLSATSTVNFASTAAQTIPIEAYGNLTISGARGNNDVTFAGSTNVAGDLRIIATGNAGAQLLFNGITSTRTFNIGGDYIQTGYEAEFGLVAGSVTTVNLTGDLVKTGGYMISTLASSNPNFNFTGTTQSIQSNGGTDTKWMNFNVNSGSTCTLAGQFNYNGSTPAGTFTVNSGGTLNCGSFNLVTASATSAVFTLASGGTLSVGSSAGITSSGATGNIQANVRNFNTGGNYIYNGGGAQAAGNGLPATIGSLSVTNNTVLTLGAAKAVSNNFSIGAGSSANLGTGFSHTAGTLTLGGFGTASGSHGSTTSAATNKNNTFFAATTGIVTATGSTCAAISATLSGTNTICGGNSSNLAVAITGGLTPYTVVHSGGTVNSYTSGSNIAVSPGSTTTYTLTSVKDLNGCPATTSGSAIVTVQTTSVAPTGITGTATVCSGGSTTLTVSGGTLGAGATVEWFTGSCGGTAAGTGNSITVSPLSNTTYYVRYTNTCNTTTCASQTVTVNTLSTAPGSITGTTTICNGTGTTLTVNGGTLGTGAVVQWFTGSCGGTSAGTGNSISVSPSLTGSYYVRYSGACNTTACISQSVTVNPRPTASVISGTAAICAGSTANIQVAVTGGTSPFSVVYSGGSIGSYISGSNIPVTPASTTTYTLTSVTDANGCVGIGNSGSAVLSIDLTTSTNGGPWSNGSPAAGKSVVFDATSVTLGADFTACSLRLKNNSIVTIPSGTDVILTGALAVETGSTFTLNNNANLLQSIPAGISYTNTGNTNVKRNSSAIKRLDYTLWSSPVTGQGVYAFSPFTFGNRFYVYRTNTNVYNNADVGFSLTGLDANGLNGTDSNNVKFAAGKGYLIRMPWDHPTAATIWNGQFTGVVNNGDIPFTMTNGGSGQRFNLVGNPYPSPISMTQFVSDNSAAITGTLYFWRETNNTTTNNAYCSWAGGTFTTNSEAQVFNPNGIIRTGQGFFVEASGAATALVFKNGQRSSDNSNQFFKNETTVNDVDETNRFWLNLTNTSGAFSQMAAGYMTNATNGVDIYDGKNINTGNVLLNSILDNTDYTIQGKALPFNASDVIPLSLKITNAGEYTITIDHVDGLFSDTTQAIYLKDNLLATEHNLQTGAYTFTSAAGTFSNRFEIVYQSQLSNPIFNANVVVIYNQDNGFVVNSGNSIMSDIKVFDIRGRLIEEKKGINANQVKINGGLSNGVLLVQITSEDGVIVTKKIIK